MEYDHFKACVMCGRFENEVGAGEWQTGITDDGIEVRLCEADAHQFDPTASYNPIAQERFGSLCPVCGHGRSVILTGGSTYQCARCLAAVPST